MEALARASLQRLLKAGEKREAGVGQRASLTRAALADYHALRSLQDKEDFEAVFMHAQTCGAVRLTRPRGEPTGLIDRVDLIDTERLANLLGRPTHASVVAKAAEHLRPRLGSYPVLAEVLDRWANLKSVRSTGPQDVQNWDDACKVIDYCREQDIADIPVRDASARLFKDSKRIEALTAQIDVLLADNCRDAPRADTEVLQEIGLFREPQPARLSGNLVVRRERGAFALDRPYCALPPSTVLAVDSTPSRVLTVENLTTFHAQARSLCDSDVLCIYTGGMPSPSWVSMYRRLLASVSKGTPVQHWGDVDEGGFRIAAFLSGAAAAAGHTLHPWKMSPNDVPEQQRRPATDGTVTRMSRYARNAGWENIARQIEAERIVAEQEG